MNIIILSYTYKLVKSIADNSSASQENAHISFILGDIGNWLIEFKSPVLDICDRLLLFFNTDIVNIDPSLYPTGALQLYL